MGMVISRRERGQRTVPLTLCLQALFGNIFAQSGWMCLGFGILSVPLFIMHSEVVASRQFRGLLETAQGTVVTSCNTNYKEGRHRTVYSVEYTFSPGTGAATITGTSYVTGRRIPNGTPVTVEYKPDHPQISRIRGLRSVELGWGALGVLFVPLIGLCFVLPRLSHGRNAIAMMRHGVPAVGTVVSVEETGMYADRRHNRDPIYEVQFRFATASGREITVRFTTLSPEPAWMEPYSEPAPSNAMGGTTPDVLGPRQEIVLYNPQNPEIAFVPAQLGDSIRVDAHGQIYGDKPHIGVIMTIIPALTIIGAIVLVGWHLLH